MLKVLFGWLDAHPWVYWAVLAAPTLALMAVVAASFWNEQADEKPGRSDLRFILVVLVCLIAWRWPFLLESREFNPDESQLIAGAITLTHDAVFWRSVDGTTSGPLNFYALLPMHALGLPLDYFTARLTGLLLISVTLIACYRLLRAWAAPAPAQLALLPLLVLFATTTDPFFLEYSSGDVSLVLFAVAAYLLFRDGPSLKAGRLGLLFGCFLCGMLPWAKLQSAPLSVGLIGGYLWLVATDNVYALRQKVRVAVVVLLAAALPTFIGLLLVVITGQFEPFVQGYLLQNIVYVGNSSSVVDAIKGMWQFTSRTHAFTAFTAASGLILLVTLCLALTFRRRLGRLFLPSLGWVCLATVCVLVPRRPYAHYLLLTIVPVTLFGGFAFGQLWPVVRVRRCLGFVVLAIGCVAPLIVRMRLPEPKQFGNFADNWRRPFSLAGTILRMSSLPGDALGVWGWRTDLYVDGRMPQATRDPHTVWSMLGTPSRDYYRERFVADMKRSRPAFFVDTVGRGAVFFQDRAGLGHETVPALGEYISQEYVLLADLQTERIYVRSAVRDDPRRNFSGAQLTRILAKARLDTLEEEDAPAPERMIPDSLGIWELNERNVRMFLPPARMDWVLDGTEAGASLTFGFHPRAYLEGRSNGADIIMELESPGSTPQILFRRHLDPARLPRSREMLSEYVPLPTEKVIAGMRLVVRTEPGEYGDQAWDWVYLASLRYVRKVERQFPGFGRDIPVAEPSS